MSQLVRLSRSIVFGLLVAQGVWAAEATLPLLKARESIEVEQIRQHVATLADDAFEGRAAGSRGGRAAATYIMRSLKANGLEPAGEQQTFYQSLRDGCRNVIARIPGGDPQLKNEVVILSAHYDHVGYGTKRNSNGPIGAVHNGADDNASGVATLLEIAEALQTYRGRGSIRRTVLLIFWDGEEQGLWGSTHWLGAMPFEPSNIRLMVNVDMVGRLRENLQLFGTRTMPGLRRMWSEANVAGEVKIDFPWQVYDNSDHFPFMQRGIPITMVHTGLHDDYHKPSDDAHRLNYAGIQRVAEIVFNLAVEAANQDALPRFRRSSLTETERQRRDYERPWPPQDRTLGVMLASDGKTVFVDSVAKGSRAEKAGLSKGDTIASVNGIRVSRIGEVRQNIRSSVGDLTLQIASESVERTVIVPFDPPGKPRVGISWRTNDAEPNTIILSRVLSRSPAESAGLKRLDRVYAMDSEPVVDSASFRSRMLAAKGEVTLLIERDGRLQEKKLQLSED